MNVKIFTLFYLVLFSATMTFSQGDPDSTGTAPDTTNVDKVPGGTVTDSSLITDYGVAIAPSSIKFQVKPGSSETKYITITNDTYKKETFSISVADYEMNSAGAVQQLPIGKSHEYGLSKWISISPTFVELKAGEARKIAITVDIPDEENAYRSAWALVMIDQTKAKEVLSPNLTDPEKMSMGVIPVFGFGVYVFQNPPNVKVNKVEITSFTFNYDNENKYVSATAKNVGDGLGFCKAYVEISNLNTGYNERLLLKRFTIFPDMERTFDYMLPGTLGKGKYSVLLVLDFGSDEQVEAAELEFQID